MTEEHHDDRLGRTDRLAQVASGAVLCAVALIVWWAVGYGSRPEVAYGYACHYEVLYEREGSIDTLILGTSRTQRAVEVDTIQAELPDEVTYRLDRPGHGIDDFVQTIEVAESQLGINRTILVELSEPGFNSSSYQSYGQFYHDRTVLSTVLSDFGSTSSVRLDGQIHDLATGIGYRFDRSLELLAEGSLAEDPPDEAILETTATDGYCRSSRSESPLNERQLENTRNRVERDFGSWDQQPPMSWSFDEVDNLRQWEYVERITELAGELGVDVVFFRMPSYLEQQMSQEFVDEFESRFGARFLAPPPDLMAEIFAADGYNNLGHVNEIGRAIFTPWFVGEMISIRESAE